MMLLKNAIKRKMEQCTMGEGTNARGEGIILIKKKDWKKLQKDINQVIEDYKLEKSRHEKNGDEKVSKK